MNLEFFIAKRLFKGSDKKSFSGPVIFISVSAIAISLAIMIISVSIVTGFKAEITNKIVGFGSHIQIVNYDNNSSYETFPISENQSFIAEIKKLTGILSINRFIIKAGIIKSEENLQGVVFKGVGKDYDWKFFRQYLVDGNIPIFLDSIRSDSILISQYLANILNLKTGDRFTAYFIQDPPRLRKFTVSGIYNTQLEDLDKTFVFLDLKHLRKINNWNEDQITGFEVHVDDIRKLLKYELLINQIVGSNFNPNGEILKVKNIKEEYPGIFDWLSLLDINVWVILVLMLSVACFNMITGLLVIILEKVSLIGILKSMGAANIKIEKIFIYLSSMLIIRGLVFGNILGLGLLFIQKYFGIIKLDPESYYLSVVPVNINVLHVLLLNVFTIITIVVMMFLPAKIISKISPSKSIKFN
ncbi:MAG: ABC transporter permease [Bacteroidales bacterium]|nr:ABC transporter permease [Bacteroidales bacterium]HOL97471.1 ABC transporter permease [Bacteroidales bacterium]HOM36010.1 ABC transporter permease [Bacteroidales bacterium]HPD23320.1 ABC transporter permease [Bacteroidales bacterium]HRS99744.1 ABC transporter permease [Bacteroidales bacterium]